MDWSPVIASVITGGCAVLGAGVMVRGTRMEMRANHTETSERLGVIEQHGVSDDRIRVSVHEFARDHPGEIGEALGEDLIRRFLDALLTDHLKKRGK